MTSPDAGHEPGPDWTCSCGYDFFGGSAAYSWQLFEAHLPSAENDPWPTWCCGVLGECVCDSLPSAENDAPADPCALRCQYAADLGAPEWASCADGVDRCSYYRPIPPGEGK